MPDKKPDIDLREIFALPKRKMPSITENPGEEALAEFSESIKPYFHRFILAQQRVHDPNSLSHPDQMRRVGGLFRDARMHAGMYRGELAIALNDANCPTNSTELAAFEKGLISVTDLAEQFPTTFKRILIERLRPRSN